MTNRKRLFLIDGSALFYRSYFAFIKNPLINSRGENTSAIYGFANSLMKILSEERPDYMAVVFDTKEPTFRHKKYEKYKATREKMPVEMSDQFPRLVELVEAFHIPVIEKVGYEADDVIATLAKKAEIQQIETIMVTGDKDFMQIISPLTKMYVIRPGKEPEIYDLNTLKKRFEMEPSQIIDYLALMGDSSDNIPGVEGIGDVTARKLVKQFGSMENLYEKIDQVSGQSNYKKLLKGKESAHLSRELVTIHTNVPLDLEIEDLKKGSPDGEHLLRIYHEQEFHSLLDRLAELLQDDQVGIKDIDSVSQQYVLVDTVAKLNEVVNRLKQSDFFVFDTETTGLNAFESDIIGISFSLESFQAYYVPLNHQDSGFTADEALQTLKPVFESADIGKGGQNIKYDGLMLWQHGIRLRGIQFDTMVAHYLISPGTRQHNLDVLAHTYLHYRMVPIESLIGKKGKNQKNMRDIAVEWVYRYACEDADITFQLKELLEKRLRETSTYDLFRDVEMPLVNVLMEMEKNGVKLDVEFLKNMSGDLGDELQKLEGEIYQMAGVRFNINSPQQLGKILFEDLEIYKEFGNRRPSRTATGQYSTAESILEKYSGHPLVGKILDYRKLMKLKSTYVDALPTLISKRTGRLHTSFNQTVTATGRLSSSDPNLQNIPIRTELGRKIRQAFIAEDAEDLILSADYSQIELRMMAHVSGDPALKEAFMKGEDIHATTAAAIFNIPIEMVNADHRRKAKEVNFGIIYGISQYGLASRLGIDSEEARQIIDNYFMRFPRVNDYVNHTIAFAHQHHYVSTILKRRRYVPEIDSKNANIRQNAERIAVNTTIQGSAADMIKLAMIHVQDRLQHQNLRTKMLLQVHDELVFEVKADELDTVRGLVKDEMENAITLEVPVKVDIGVGKNWLDAH